jgi:hypothetical protein
VRQEIALVKAEVKVDADVQALRKKLAPKRLVPFAAVGAGLAALTVVIRRIRRARR